MGLDIDTETALAIYAAGLSTITALVSFARMMRDRPSIAVQASFSFTPASEDNDTTPKGILVEMNEPGLMYECTVRIRIVNRGRRAVEVVAVLVEGLIDANVPKISTHEIRPQPLPAVLEPLSSIETTIQKEHFDQDDELLFLGVVDALGHRHAAADEDIRKMLETNQTLPTSIAVYARRDDPTKKITAWHAKDRAVLTTRPLGSTRWPLGREMRRVARARRRGWPRPVSPAAREMRAAIRTAADE